MITFIILLLCCFVCFLIFFKNIFPLYLLYFPLYISFYHAYVNVLFFVFCFLIKRECIFSPSFFCFHFILGGRGREERIKDGCGQRVYLTILSIEMLMIFIIVGIVLPKIAVYDVSKLNKVSQANQ